MERKDTANKYLFSFNDVFADFVNATVFNGEQIVAPEDLVDVDPHTFFKNEGKLREQVRDVAKKWKKGDVVFLLVGVEFQSQIDPDMVFRAASYDGAFYRAQLADQKTKRRYPVVTFVLYFGSTPWTRRRTLLESVDIPEGIKDAVTPYVNDYRLNIVDVARMGDREIEKFKSDLNVLVDYYVKTLNDPAYMPKHTTLTHPDASFHFMSAVMNDPAYEQESYSESGERMDKMSYVVETLRRLGRQDAEDEYRSQLAEKDRQLGEQGRQLGEKDRQLGEKDRQIDEKDRMLRITVSYMHDDGLSPEEIAERMKADVETIRKILDL